MDEHVLFPRTNTTSEPRDVREVLDSWSGHGAWSICAQCKDADAAAGTETAVAADDGANDETAANLSGIASASDADGLPESSLPDNVRTAGYLLWAIAFIPATAAVVVTVGAIVVGIDALFSLGVLSSAVLGLLPAMGIATAVFVWMDAIPAHPASSFLHMIGATIVASEVFLLFLSCWRSMYFGTSRTVEIVLLVAFLAVLVWLLVQSLKSFVRLARRSFISEQVEHMGAVV